MLATPLLPSRTQLTVADWTILSSCWLGWTLIKSTRRLLFLRFSLLFLVVRRRVVVHVYILIYTVVHEKGATLFLPRDARSAKCGIASVSRPSVWNVLRYRGHTRWTSSKVITRVISLGLRSSVPQHRQSSSGAIPTKFGWNRGGVAVLNRKPAISLKGANQDQGYYW